MKSELCLVVFALLYCCFSIPTQNNYFQIPQTLLKVDTSSAATGNIVIDDNDGWFYFTNIELGTPPQAFRAAIDIGWYDTFVPSTLCVDQDCAHHHLYDHAQSTSYSSNGTAVHMHYTGFYTSGFASVDTLRIGNIIISNQAFEEATLLKPVPLWDNLFDSTIGFSRLQIDDSQSSLRARSPFHNMIQQGLLHRNFFSLRLSDSNVNISGELRFATTNTDLYIEPLITFPVSTIYSIDPRANIFLAPGWQISAQSLSHVFPSSSSSSPSSITPKTSHFSLTGYVAAFSTVFPFISLPQAIGQSLLENLGVEPRGEVDCDTRDSLPSLVISLGSQSNSSPFVLKPRDYIRRQLKWDDPWIHEDKCTVVIALHDEPPDSVKYIVLGSAFPARWYSVFDCDNAMISLATLV